MPTADVLAFVCRMTKWVNWMLLLTYHAFIYNCSVTTRRKKKKAHTQKEALTSRRPPLLSPLPQQEKHSSLSCFVAKTQCRRRVYPKRPQCTTASCRGRVEAAAGNGYWCLFSIFPRFWQKRSLRILVFPIGFFELKTTVASSCRGHRGCCCKKRGCFSASTEASIASLARRPPQRDIEREKG